ncbi:hypothetical protein L9G15_19205 [Shewanella sp. A3A]|nr:hypothetical protein [Shewanella ferrihydritica]
MSKPSLEQLLEHAPKAIAPERDLWPQIEQRLTAASKPRPMRQMLAASVLVVVGALSYALWQPQQRPNPELLAMLAELQQQHQQQMAQLEQKSQWVQWQPASLTTPINQGVSELQQASDKIYHALQQDPQNQQLWQLWLWSQKRQIELLTQGQQLPVPANNPTQGIRI